MKIVTYTKRKLENILKKNFTNKDCDFYLNDQSYAVMDASWIKTECYKGYRKWLDLAGIDKWKTNWDCDNFAQSFKMYVNLLHARANPETFTSTHKSGNKNACDARAAGVGVIFFKNSDRSAHAINVVATEEDEVLFFEPDDGDFLNLSDKHKETTWYVNL